jgi:two-component system response regulator FixJ
MPIMQLDEIVEVKQMELRDMISSKKQIYIVDDDESVSRALKLLLITYAFQVETFDGAEKFFSAVPNSTPGCLILDIHMPGLGGWEAQQRLTKSGSKRPVIIISADKSGELKERALRTGAVGFLQKPFNDQDLVDLINQAFTIEEKK